MKEVDIARPVIAWLEEQGWDVYQEVKVYSAIADIVAVHAKLVWVIECKTSLSMAVLEQAWGWKAHYRSIAVPAGKQRNRRFAYWLAKNKLNIGVITVGHRVTEQVAAPLMRENHRLAVKIRESLREEHKYFAEAGSARGGHYTLYRASIEKVKTFISKNSGCTIGDIFDHLGKLHYASNQSMRSTIPKNLMWIHKDWCRIDTSERPFRYYVRET